MSKKTRIKADAIAHWIPRDRDEVNEGIAELGRLQRERERIKADMNDQIEVVKAAHEETAKPLADRISELTKGVHLWCEANRARLTDDGKVKFHDFSTGTVKWRLTPWSIGLSKVADVIELLKAKFGKTDNPYVRVVEEVNKEALLEDRAKLDTRIEGNTGINGVKFNQKEIFSVIPNESQIEEVQP